MDPVIPTVESTGSGTSPEYRRKRRKREVETETRQTIGEDQGRHGAKRWRTDREQQIYSSKLVEALRRVRRRSNDAGKIPVREIRDTADRVLAASARGTTRWSRALLASRVRARLRKHKKAKLTGNLRSRRLPEKATEMPTRMKLPAVERKLKFLGRLVPGCRKVSVPNLLEEATDYIAALEMQVRAMAALAELLSTAPPPPSSTGA
ncbi:PREDICTED: transcription factor bHLH149-like [Tarenaya hassleriana]|uniref:transcription factor bHLH149-like n=1 Tax=Tarenaya hassleriana TaxID=28532 RepID=UPI00053C115E|nr:PREDICTED: transcription factor bHLH149-like [Tarenaya hassleriana]